MGGHAACALRHFGASAAEMMSTRGSFVQVDSVNIQRRVVANGIKIFT